VYGGPAISDKTTPTQPTPLPTLETGLTPEEVLDRLDRLARKGKLPGYEPGPGPDEFRVLAFGEPFDQEVLGRIGPAHGAGAHQVTFTLRTKRRLPAVFAVVTAFTIWPGVLLTDALIPASWGWWPTWTWYLPLTILPLPFLLPRMWKKSGRAARGHADEQIGKIAAALGAEVVGGEETQRRRDEETK
jgi:hypothetical protein